MSKKRSTCSEIYNKVKKAVEDDKTKVNKKNNK